MKLTSARLCLDCDEVHDEPHCPACSSESFVFLTRWVDPGGQRPSVRKAGHTPTFDPERLAAYQALTAPERPRGTGRRVLGAVAGVATLGMAGWLWAASRRAAAAREDAPPSEGRDRPGGPK